MPLSYQIEVENQTLAAGSKLSAYLHHVSLNGRLLVVIDDCVDILYGERLRATLVSGGITHDIIRFRTSESAKNINSLTAILDALDRFKFSRRQDCVLAIGGGVLLDIVGLAASLYRRGVEYVRVPTTLLSMVDASVGVKTGANYRGGKNRIGTYYPPCRVFVDPSFLVTVPDHQIRSGLAEIVKIAAVCDVALFEKLEHDGVRAAASRFGDPCGVDLIAHAIEAMVTQLEPNLWEREMDRHVDFGHSFSPSLEMSSVTTLIHGDAVALDIALSCAIAFDAQLLPRSAFHRVLHLMSAFGLPTRHPLMVAPFLYEALRETTRHRGGEQRLPLPTRIGAGKFVNNVTVEAIAGALETLAIALAAIESGSPEIAV